jgi:hypothetical protein
VFCWQRTPHGTRVLDAFAAVHNTRLIALDGTWYFSSEKIHCEHCSRIKHQEGQTTYYHSAITPVIVAPDQPYAIPLRPEFTCLRAAQADHSAGRQHQAGLRDQCRQAGVYGRKPVVL